MKNENPFSADNHKDHFTYNNPPFINPEHGELQTIHWATVNDARLLEASDPDAYEVTPPSYFLQITPLGVIRGVTHDYDEHEEYFSATAEDGDVMFLKAFSEQYPEIAPTLSDLYAYRKYSNSKRREYALQIKLRMENGDIDQ